MTKVVLFENEWPKIRPVVLKLLSQESVSKQEWQELFWTVHNLNSWAEKVATPIKDALEVEVSYFISAAKQRILSHQDSPSLLKAYISEWQKFYDQSLYLHEPFRMIDNLGSSTSPKNRRNSPLVSSKSSLINQRISEEGSFVRKLMLEAWNKHIFSQVKERLQQAAMQLIMAERNGEAFDAQLVVGVRESYVSLCVDHVDRLSIYRLNFEKAYLDATEQFYCTKAAAFLQENGVQIYVKYADQKLFEEDQRARRYLETGPDSESVKLLLEKCVLVLIASFQDQILAECPRLIETNESEKLRLIFRLINRTSTGIIPMLKFLEDHIRNQGLADMMENASHITTDPEKYIERLLVMFNRFSCLIKTAFYDDPRFLTSRDKAFQDVVNDTTIFRLQIVPTQSQMCGLAAPAVLQKNLHTSKLPYSSTPAESKCPELLANYCDLLLRKSQLSKKLTCDDIDAKIQDVLLVLKYVQNKDVFMKCHKMHLIRRLIFDTSADQEKEEVIVNRLRECGMPTDYINKFFRMLQDMEINKDLNRLFKANSLSSIAESVNVKILNAGAWLPKATEKVSVSLPRELEDVIPEVEEFYRKQHNGRRLRWHHQWSNGIITFNNKYGKFELEVTTFQLATLFCWNDRPDENSKISYENLRLATDLPDVELRKTLWSLVATPKLKFQVLLCGCESKNPKDFTDSTLFWPNDDFVLIKNNKIQNRGRLNLIGRLQITPVDQIGVEQEHEDILQLRVLRVQEAIVKIMKMRKRMPNSCLQAELVDILKPMFLPTRKLIKEQIEWLIENRFIARDEKDINFFIYVA